MRGYDSWCCLLIKNEMLKMKVLSHKRILYINSNQGHLQFSATTGPYHACMVSFTLRVRAFSAVCKRDGSWFHLGWMADHGFLGSTVYRNASKVRHLFTTFYRSILSVLRILQSELGLQESALYVGMWQTWC